MCWFKKPKFKEEFIVPRIFSTSKCVITDKYVKLNSKKLSVKKSGLIHAFPGWSSSGSCPHGAVYWYGTMLRIRYKVEDEGRFVDATLKYNARICAKTNVDKLRLYETYNYCRSYYMKVQNAEKIIYVDNLLKEFVKENPVFSKIYYMHHYIEKLVWIVQREPRIHGKEIDIETAMEIYKKESEAERRLRRGRSASTGGGSIIEDVVKIGVGVATVATATSKLKQSRQREEKKYYTCPISCKFEYRKHGMPRCRLSTDDRCHPEKCGHGRRYR